MTRNTSPTSSGSSAEVGSSSHKPTTLGTGPRIKLIPPISSWLRRSTRASRLDDADRRPLLLAARPKTVT